MAAGLPDFIIAQSYIGYAVKEAQVMRVSGAECIRVSQLGLAPRPGQPSVSGSLATAPARGASGAAAAAAEARISPEASEIQRVVGKVVGESDYREDVVAELRERIQSGTYHVTGQQIGEMMVRRMLADRVR
jgi:negative regulator of flagellin synthesis FlgM